MRVEITYMAPVVLCRVYALDGRLIVRGSGATETEARDNAAEHLHLRENLANLAYLAQEVADENCHSPAAQQRNVLMLLRCGRGMRRA